MLNTIVNLGRLISVIEEYCDCGTLSIAEAAFVANMIGDVEDAISFIENGGRLHVSSNTNYGSFENMEDAFEFFAEEIIDIDKYYNDYDTKRNYEVEQKKLAKEMLFNFKGNESNIKNLVKCHFITHFHYLAERDKKAITYIADNYCCDKRFMLMGIER